MMDLLKQHGFRAIQGIDVSAEQVSLAKKRGYDVVLGDAYSFFQTTDSRFGLILAIDFLEHFAKEELIDLLGAIHDALRPGGILLIQTPNGQGLLAGQVVFGDFSHLTILNPQSLRQVLRLVGFNEIYISEAGPVPRGLTNSVRYILWRFIGYVATLAKFVETGKWQSIWTENLICRAEKPLGDAG